MPIPVVCPGCKKRFSVSDKFAGKKGPCPQCKTVIQVPEKGEEVVVHAPEEFGPKDAKGRAVLKPIARKETKVSPLLTGVILLAIVAVLVGAWMLRSSDGKQPLLLLALGAIALAPPLAWAGYSFLRDDELEPYSGKELSLRILVCSAVYAALWGLVALVTGYVLGGDKVEVLHMVFIAPVMIGIGTFAAYLSLDLEAGTAAIHCSLYLLVTVTLRLILGLSAF
jgi:cation transport ATPase